MPGGPIEISQISTFSKLSLKARKRFLEFMFSQPFYIPFACFQAIFYFDLNILLLEVAHVKNTMFAREKRARKVEMCGMHFDTIRHNFVLYVIPVTLHASVQFMEDLDKSKGLRFISCFYTRK